MMMVGLQVSRRPLRVQQVAVLTETLQLASQNPLFGVCSFEMRGAGHA